MNGHVRQRGATWAFVVDLEGQRAQRCGACNARRWVERERLTDTCTKCGGTMTEAHGERRQVWRSGYKTKNAAQKAMRALLGRADTGRDPLPQEMIVRDWVEHWLTSDRVRDLRPHTRHRYRQVLADYLLPDLGAMRLLDVRPRHIRAALDRMTEQGLSGRTRNETRNIASTLFRAAVEDELLEVNPATAVRAKPHKRRELVTPTTEELAKLVGAANDTVWAMPIALAAYLGLRRSEVLGLQWRDVDVESATLRVQRGLQRVRTGERAELVFLPTKTANSARTIELGENLVERLRRHRTAQTQRRLLLGAAWVDVDLVCDRGDGGPLHPDSLSKAFVRIARSAGLSERVRLHDVRHAVATSMLADGVDMKLASAVLGHSSANFTRDQYVHVLKGMTREATNAIDRALG
jgi:integrase